MAAYLTHTLPNAAPPQALEAFDAAWQALAASGPCAQLTIDPLHAGWDTPLEPNHFRSGCAPILALDHACKLIRSGSHTAVRITGKDLLRTQYEHDKPTRSKLMMIYGPDCPIPHAYTLLARAFMARHHIDEATFKNLAILLYDNYNLTAWLDSIPSTPPKPENFNFITKLFRQVDCANPVIDFHGSIIVSSTPPASGPAIEVLGTAVAQTSADGPDHIDEIVRYDHLAAAARDLETQTGKNLKSLFDSGQTLLDAYTCFPVVPLALLLTLKFAESPAALADLLTSREITVTAGMNIARAPWNNPTLHALITMHHRLVNPLSPSFGLVHGNGGLGYKQGLALLQRL